MVLEGLHRGRLIRRYKRFFAEVELLEGSAPITISSQLRHEVSGQIAEEDAFDPRAGRGLGEIALPPATLHLVELGQRIQHQGL